MKRFIVILMVLTMVMSFVACDNSNTAQDVGSTQPNTTADSDQTTKKASKDKDTDSMLVGTYKVSLEDIYIDTPNFQSIEQGYTQLYIIHDVKYVAITATRRLTAEGPQDAHEQMKERFINNMRNYEGGVNSLNITKDEMTTINGIDVYSFEGTINYGRSTIHDGYAKGYSFEIDGVPCQIVGSVIDDSQSQELIDEISEIVDQMMESVRTEL